MDRIKMTRCHPKKCMKMKKIESDFVFSFLGQCFILPKASNTDDAISDSIRRTTTAAAAEAP